MGQRKWKFSILCKNRVCTIITKWTLGIITFMLQHNLNSFSNVEVWALAHCVFLSRYALRMVCTLGNGNSRSSCHNY